MRFIKLMSQKNELIRKMQEVTLDNNLDIDSKIKKIKGYAKKTDRINNKITRAMIIARTSV